MFLMYKEKYSPVIGWKTPIPCKFGLGPHTNASFAANQRCELSLVNKKMKYIKSGGVRPNDTAGDSAVVDPVQLLGDLGTGSGCNYLPLLRAQMQSVVFSAPPCFFLFVLVLFLLLVFFLFLILLR